MWSGDMLTVLDVCNLHTSFLYNKFDSRNEYISNYDGRSIGIKMFVSLIILSFKYISGFPFLQK